MKPGNHIRFLTICTILLTMLFITVPQGKAAIQFTDIKGHWAEAAIQKMTEAGVASGFPDAAFRPDNNISRAEFAVLIVKTLSLESTSGKVFSDTSQHWAKEQIAAANAYGVVNGYDHSTFGPDDPITREQMALMIVKAAKLPVTLETPYCLDSERVSSWARDAVVAAYEQKIIAGMPDGSFQPQAYATRAQAVTVLNELDSIDSIIKQISWAKSAIKGYVLEVTFAEGFNVDDAAVLYTNNASPIKREFFASTHEGGNVYRYLGEDISESDTIGFYINDVLVQTININES